MSVKRRQVQAARRNQEAGVVTSFAVAMGAVTASFLDGPRENQAQFDCKQIGSGSLLSSPWLSIYGSAVCSHPL